MLYLAAWVGVRDGVNARRVHRIFTVCVSNWRHEWHPLAQGIGVDMKKRTVLKLKVDVA